MDPLLPLNLLTLPTKMSPTGIISQEEGSSKGTEGIHGPDILQSTNTSFPFTPTGRMGCFDLFIMANS